MKPTTTIEQVLAMTHAATLRERIHKIDMVMQEYGEENFYVSFSGGKDSTVMHHLIDMARPGNEIPRVYADTGIEYNAVREFVQSLAEKDNRFVIIKPSVPIKQMLESEGYPFKSKWHSRIVERFQQVGFDSPMVRIYLGMEGAASGAMIPGDHSCPKILRYQFEGDGLPFKVSQNCCSRMKKEPMKKWQKEHGNRVPIIGLMRSEGGQRDKAQCLAFRDNKLTAFQPLAPLTKEWEDWFIEEYDIELCKLYYPPYNFNRTGCKGCPFALEIQEELDTLDKYFPNERKQCERIWKPVYDEYRRIGYRKMRPLEDGRQMDITEFLEE